ncbi:hypothetical protein GH733_002528 [Mirounga leonina]|nr:hypothetical protein GH733_002528 [Mirounga leonina]
MVLKFQMKVNVKGRNVKDSEMKQKLAEEGSKCSILSKHQKFVEHCCMRCCSPFTFLVNTKRRCADCKFNVCKSCCSYQKREKVWICCVCQQARFQISHILHVCCYNQVYIKQT